MTRPAEITEFHTRILRVTLEVDNAREYWRRPEAHVDSPSRSEAAFHGYWFGSRSAPRIHDLLANFDLRFAAFPSGLAALSAWPDLPQSVRIPICHWHLQLADPLYRAFAGELCVDRRESGRPLTRDVVVRWVGGVDSEGRWSPASHLQFASKLLSCAHSAGLVGTRRDPRPVVAPRVPDAALGYLLYLLRDVDFRGSLHANPYLASVGIDVSVLDDRLRSIPGISLRRAANVVEVEFDYPSPRDWVTRTQQAA